MEGAKALGLKRKWFEDGVRVRADPEVVCSHDQKRETVRAARTPINITGRLPFRGEVLRPRMGLKARTSDLSLALSLGMGL